MTMPVRAGERLTGGKRDGYVGAIAKNPRGEIVAVTARRIFEDSFSSITSQLQANDLLTAVPIADGRGGPCQPHVILETSAALGLPVFRETADVPRAPGSVSALYGTVAARNSKTPLNIRGLLAVTFAEISDRSTARIAMPPISESELGRLVMSYEGAGIGLIVGGEGHLAIVAPLYPFFHEHKLTLVSSDFNVVDIGVGLDLLYNDLSRTPMLELGEMPEAA